MANQILSCARTPLVPAPKWEPMLNLLPLPSNESDLFLLLKALFYDFLHLRSASDRQFRRGICLK